VSETRLKMPRFVHQKTPPPKSTRVEYLQSRRSCWIAIDQLYLRASKTRSLTTRENNDFMMRHYSVSDNIQDGVEYGRDRQRASTICSQQEAKRRDSWRSILLEQEVSVRAQEENISRRISQDTQPSNTAMNHSSKTLTST
jgi:hypothetical protein